MSLQDFHKTILLFSHGKFYRYRSDETVATVLRSDQVREIKSHQPTVYRILFLYGRRAPPDQTVIAALPAETEVLTMKTKNREEHQFQFSQ